ncbi:class I SAM-dependent methyltransferase [Actinomadura sp. 9N215]|uniref:class I SAM-dependent methyltransferase n=1 Tax=Actinomadura sp. 9N215 TaxID=3375150 RepID=UPI00379BA086
MSVASPAMALDNVPGWFYRVDRHVFEHLLGWQNSTARRGDIAELGTFVGKTAILLGAFLLDGQRLTVCDLFGEPTEDKENQAEVETFYRRNPGEQNTSSLMADTYDRMRAAFEQNYLSFHPELPHIVQGPTARAREYVEPNSYRFVHVDASHLHRNVRDDIGVSRDLLADDGILALDDFRKEVTPGVAAAAWEAVATRGLRPVCVTNNKLYGTWGDPAPAQRTLEEWAEGRPGYLTLVQEVFGQRLLILVDKDAMRGPASEAPVTSER